MKILFLDCDGVMNSIQSEIYYENFGEGDKYSGKFCPIAASNLKYLLDTLPDLNIVISSSWRLNRMDILEDYFKEFNLPWNRVIGRTKWLRKARGIEIQDWLDNHPAEQVEDFVILDDSNDMVHLEIKLVQTSPKIGLTIIEAEQILKRFDHKT